MYHNLLTSLPLLLQDIEFVLNCGKKAMYMSMYAFVRQETCLVAENKRKAPAPLSTNNKLLLVHYLDISFVDSQLLNYYSTSNM